MRGSLGWIILLWPRTKLPSKLEGMWANQEPTGWGGCGRGSCVEGVIKRRMQLFDYLHLDGLSR